MKPLVTFVLAVMVMMAQDGKTHLKVGDVAPDFKMSSSVPGKTFTLSEFKGKKSVVVAFFPLAFTGGCTNEMKGFQTGLKSFDEADSQVFGVSVDAAPSLKRFSDDLTLEFPLLSDFPNKSTAKAYGVLMAERGIASRTTFVVDKEGKIAEIVADQRPAPHNEASIAACQRLKK